MAARVPSSPGPSRPNGNSRSGRTDISALPLAMIPGYGEILMSSDIMAERNMQTGNSDGKHTELARRFFKNDPMMITKYL